MNNISGLIKIDIKKLTQELFELAKDKDAQAYYNNLPKRKTRKRTLWRNRLLASYIRKNPSDNDRRNLRIKNLEPNCADIAEYKHIVNSMTYDSISNMRKAGFSFGHIYRATGISKRTVLKILEEHNEHSKYI